MFLQKVTMGSVIGLGALVVALGACHHHRGAQHGAHHGDRDHDEHTGEHESPELGSGLSTHHAVHAIAKARCEREEHCDNIGTDKSYTSLAACEDKIRADWAGDLNKYECPRGIVKSELDACLTGVRNEACGNPFDTLARVTACNANDICKGD